jgi:hypothetical protein
MKRRRSARNRSILILREHSPQQVVGLEGHYKKQGLSVPVRSVSPFSIPLSGLHPTAGDAAKELINLPL